MQFSYWCADKKLYKVICIRVSNEKAAVNNAIVQLGTDNDGGGQTKAINNRCRIWVGAISLRVKKSEWVGGVVEGSIIGDGEVEVREVKGDLTIY